MRVAFVLTGLGIAVSVYAQEEIIKFGNRKLSVHKEAKNWEMAHEACKIKNRHLATVLGYNEISNLKIASGGQSMWLGGRWLDSGWTWLRLALPIAGELPVPPDGHHCLTLNGDAASTLTGYNCTKALPFICEFISKKVDRQQHDEVQYTVYNMRLPWQKAMDFCKASSRTLATPNNYRHARYLASFTREFHELWLGAEFSGNAWRWRPSGEVLDGHMQPNVFPPWAEPPPAQAGLCLVLTRGPAGIPVFQHKNCSEVFNFICQYPITGPRGWSGHSVEMDGRLYTFEQHPQTWKEAQTACQSSGSALLTMTDHNSFVFFAQQARYAQSMWLGARRSQSGWEWTSSLETVCTKSKGKVCPVWAGTRDEPTHDCLAIDLRNPDRPMFVPRPCTEYHYYVCERADREYEHFTKVIQLPNRQLVLIEDRRNFDEAVKACETYEGVLATLNTTALLKLVQPHSKKFAGLWIGARSDGKGVMRWLATSKEAHVLVDRSLVVWEEDTEVVVTHDQFKINPRRLGDLADIPDTNNRHQRKAVEGNNRHRRNAGQGPSLQKKPSQVCMELSRKGVSVESACNIKRSFVCETRADVTLLHKETLTVGNATYVVFMNKVPWDKADKICQNSKGQLAQLKPSETQILEQLRKVYKDLWLGGHVENSVWRWNDGAKVLLPEKFVPDVTSGRRCVGASRVGPRQSVSLQAWDCSVPHGFLCRLVAQPAHHTLINNPKF